MEAGVPSPMGVCAERVSGMQWHRDVVDPSGMSVERCCGRIERMDSGPI